MKASWAERFNKPLLTGNWVLDMHPLVKMNIMIACCIMDFVIGNLYFSLGLIVMVYTVSALAGKIRSFHKLFGKIIVVFGVFWFLFQAAFSEGQTVLVKFAGICVTREGVVAGLSSSLLILAFSGMFLLFYHITPMNHLTLALEQLGMSRTASFVFLSAFQSITDLSANAKIIQESQKARGIETEGGVLVRVKAYIPVLGPLVLNAVSSTEEKTIAMEARAFSAKSEATQLCILAKPDVKQIMLLFVFNAALVGSIVFRIRGCW